MFKRLVLLGFVVAFILGGSVCQADEWSGSVELGERLFSLEEPAEEGYNFVSAYLRYKGDLKSKDYWYFRFDFQDNIYFTRKVYDSRTFDMTGSIVHFLKENWRCQLELKLRDKSYPYAKEKSYRSVYPTLSIRWDINPASRLETEYSLQGKFFPRQDEKNNWTHTMALGGQHKLGKDLTLRGRYRACLEELDDYRLRHSILLGFNYRP